ncbi:MAG: YmaF family protein [Pelotomaculum sp. PtaB.Bin104]|nr:MAG: YmaF family protein [Pelotomaculum sp. PtaB.Bin104]
MPSENNDYQNYHVHDYSGLTTCNDGHCHNHPGVTSIPIPYGSSHYHQIVGATTYDDGHFHVYCAATGVAVPLPDGYHTHFTSFTTSVADGHTHGVMEYVKAIKPEEEEYPPATPYKK